MIARPEQQAYVKDVAALGTRNLPPGGEHTLHLMCEQIPQGARRILDLGCNTGWTTSVLAQLRPGADVVGIDISPDMITTAGATYQAGNLSYLRLDAGQVAQEFTGVDAIVCFGSSAFFADETEVFAAIRAALDERTRFVNAHYVYDPATPQHLRERERDEFGVSNVPTSAQQCLQSYEKAGFDLGSYRRQPRWLLPDRAHADIYRSILKNLPGMDTVVDDMLRRRLLIQALCAFRHPVIVSTETPPADAGHEHASPARVLKAMQFFRLPFKAQPIERLRAMRPYEFLAYIGDPDAAPGGAAAVTRAAHLLRELGLPEHAEVLDVGSFTGMSTFALAEVFPHTTGIDIDGVFVAAASMLGACLSSRARFQHGDAAQTGREPASLDAVVMTATLGYTPDPHKLLQEAFRVLRPGGLFVEFLYHHRDCGDAAHALVHSSVGPDVRLRALSSQVNDIEDAGFRLIRAERIVTPTAEPTAASTVIDALIAQERARNSPMTDAEQDEFASLLRRYLSRDIATALDAKAYLCVFEKPT
ncbi:methyltransferase domain-containing protein [Catellatospora coxensis]|uniref:Methyltransferase domain-containing protein n=1 Tax=Catellatospora coxensis TaxID=310354 RepID=A0A8J3L5L0_9ACTN|nr:methyltransferase domain-containing protein [Catellatospora coxensis]GIG08961.1 hypothetical protein Cco03nite_56610 [Catellatospora coxensis]